MTEVNGSRRTFLGAIGAAAGLWAARSTLSWAGAAPAGPVAVSKCATYGPDVTMALDKMFDRLGGLEGLVRGKTVAIKLNLTGLAVGVTDGVPIGETNWVHPEVIGATVHLLGKAGARCIRLLESPSVPGISLEDFMLKANWQARDFASAAPRVEFENTNWLGSGKRYSRFMVPGGGLLFPGYDLNHSYEDCDVFVSLAKLKQHTTVGITLSMKNCFGNTPCTIYGEDVPEDEPSLLPRGGRGLFHSGRRVPPKSAPQPVNLRAFRANEGGYLIPRAIADLVAARPIHLAIIDGIHTVAGGEGTWNKGSRRVEPGVLIAGTNCVSTDAVATAIMGFDPMAVRGTPPFESSDNTLALAEQIGVGTRDLNRIEVIGTPIEKARFNFRAA